MKPKLHATCVLYCDMKLLEQEKQWYKFDKKFGLKCIMTTAQICICLQRDVIHVKSSPFEKLSWLLFFCI